MAASSTPAPTALDQPLPPDVVAGMTWGPFRYRKYPVFSWPWCRHRFLVSVIAVALYDALATLGQLAIGRPHAGAALSAFYLFAGVMLMFSTGPALATAVRHLRLTEKKEAWGVIAAVLLGIVVTLFSDAWASTGIKHALRVKEVPPADRKLGELEKSALALTAVTFGCIYFASSGGLAVFAYFSERRRLRARRAHLARLESDMRLSVLQAQIEPHFLFNTLAAIRPLIREDPSRAEAAIDAFAAHLRDTIPRMRADSGTATSTLGQQVEICASYLAVMQVRMDARLHSEIEVPAPWRALAFPPLILLSLVENAIKHGLEPKTGRGCIRIQAEVTGTLLHVSVLDDGVGLQDGLGAGLGLSNIREQLAVRFAGRATLRVAARPEGGTVAAITFPLSPPNP